MKLLEIVKKAFGSIYERLLRTMYLETKLEAFLSFSEELLIIKRFSEATRHIFYLEHFEAFF